MSKQVQKVCNAISTVAVVLVVILALLLVGVRLVGLRPMCVLSGSMEPTYHTGSLIYVGFSTDDLRVRPDIYGDTENRLMERLVHLILSVFRTRFSDSDGSDELIGNLLHAMVLLLNRVCNESHIRQPDLLYARRFIDENMNRKIDFTGLAKSMGMTFDLFRRSFKKKYGVSPKNYLIDLRLEKAKKMLEEPDRNCTQVVLECGFSSSAQFSTMFREKYGITPPKKYALEKKGPARSAEETP